LTSHHTFTPVCTDPTPLPFLLLFFVSLISQLGGEEEHDDDHAVTGHLFYDIYKAMALG